MTDINLHRSVELFAPAKINLFLHVLRRRADGYHDLETWMQKLDFGDTVELHLRNDGLLGLVCSDPSLPTDRSNLAWRAAEEFFLPIGGGKGMVSTSGSTSGSRWQPGLAVGAAMPDRFCGD